MMLKHRRTVSDLFRKEKTIRYGYKKSGFIAEEGCRPTWTQRSGLGVSVSLPSMDFGSLWTGGGVPADACRRVSKGCFSFRILAKEAAKRNVDKSAIVTQPMKPFSQ